MSEEVNGTPSIMAVPTASDLRRMPKDRRDAILEEAARIAEEIYRNDPSLTDFEAFEADDPHGDGETTSEG